VQKYHVAIIGKKGASSQQFSERHNVELQFPAQQNDNENGNQQQQQVNESVQSRKPPPNSDLIYISGLREDCEKAKEAILALIPQTAQTEFPSEFHKLLLVDKALMIRDIDIQINVQTNVPKKDEIADYVQIVGTLENVEAAKKEIESAIKNLEESIPDEVIDDTKWHKSFLDKRAALKNRLSVENCNVEIYFSRSDANSYVVTLKGPKEAVQSTKQKIVD